jgi:hypothetical protein
LLKAKVKYWADLQNYVKENYYYDRVADYIVAKKNFRLLKKQLLQSPNNKVQNLYRVVDSYHFNYRFPKLHNEYLKYGLKQSVNEDRLLSTLKDQVNTIQVLKQKVAGLKILNHNLNKIGLSRQYWPNDVEIPGSKNGS